MVLVLPVGTAPDEAEHAYRAYQLSTGQLFPTLLSCPAHLMLSACRDQVGPYVPTHRAGGSAPLSMSYVINVLAAHNDRPGIVSRFNASLYAPLTSQALGGPNGFVHFENTALYSPANYLPQIAVLWLARHVGNPVLATLFEARFVAGLVWVICITAAVAIVPRWKWLFALVLLVPTELAQAGTMNADSMTFSASALMIAYSLRLADQERAPSRSQIARLSALALVMGFMKVPIPLIIVAALIAMWPTLGTARQRLWRAAAVAGPAFVAAAWWTIKADKYFVPYRNTVFKPALQVFINQHAQEQYLLHSITSIPGLFWQTLVTNNLINFSGMFGTVGQDGRSGPLPGLIATIWFIAFGLLILANHEGNGPGRRVRIGLAAVIVVYFFVTAFSLYLTWTAVGANEISGIHGRYMTPVLALLIPILAGLGGKRLRISELWTARAAMALSAFAAVVLIAHTAHYFYNDTPWTALHSVLSVMT